MIQKLLGYIKSKRYLIYTTKFDDNDLSYLFFNQSTDIKDWYYKNNFTRYINDAKKYTKKEVEIALSNTLLNKFELF